MCGACCRGFEEGEVYLYMDDISRLTKFLGYKNKAGLRKFARKYLKIIEDSFYWKEPGAKRGCNYKFQTLGFKFIGDDDRCSFLDKNKCTVHKARPMQCKIFPFWVQMLEHFSNIKDYSIKCSALQNSLENRGKFHSREEILKWGQLEHEIEKKYFLEMKRNDFDIFKMYKFLPKDITS